ncbi:MAG: alpha/beta fold hydrolase BchO [Pseudomonadota bacterium]
MIFGSDKPDWATDGADWPNRVASRFVRAGGLAWHVQVTGQGPDCLLLHGVGAASHSWRGLLPMLARRYRMIALDLPGHGFTQTPAVGGLSIAGMARLVAAVLEALEARPALVVGHSAGAPLAAWMALEGQIAPDRIVALNGAFVPFQGLAGQVFPPLAKLLVLNPFAPRFMAFQATDPFTVPRIIRATGSRLDPQGLDFYRRLIRRAGHVSAALRMMASWDLEPVMAGLHRLDPPLSLVVGERDRAIPPADAARVAETAREAAVTTLPGLGHLMHEEAPERLAALIAAEAQATEANAR